MYHIEIVVLDEQASTKSRPNQTIMEPLNVIVHVKETDETEKYGS